MSEMDGLKLLRRIEEGVAGKTGEAFFRQIVCDLARALNAHSAFTSRLLPGRRASMLAFWSGGTYEQCLEYALEGTPCEYVYRGEITSYAPNVGDVFPVDRAWFEQLGIKSYLGIPVKDETGAVCGHLAVMDTRERTGPTPTSIFCDSFQSDRVPSWNDFDTRASWKVRIPHFGQRMSGWKGRSPNERRWKSNLPPQERGRERQSCEERVHQSDEPRTSHSAERNSRLCTTAQARIQRIG